MNLLRRSWPAQNELHGFFVCVCVGGGAFFLFCLGINFLSNFKICFDLDFLGCFCCSFLKREREFSISKLGCSQVDSIWEEF